MNEECEHHTYTVCTCMDTHKAVHTGFSGWLVGGEGEGGRLLIHINE